MKECQFCKEDIKEGAKVCPHCKRTQVTSAFKVFMWTYIISAFAFAIWALIYMASLIP